MNSINSDIDLLTALRTDSETAFTELYHRYASALYRYAMNRINDSPASEEIVQELFISLWQRRTYLSHVTNVKAYLYSAVRHRVANHIAHSIIRIKYAQHYEAFAARSENTTETQLNLADLNATVEQSLASLPEKCQKVFRLSRYEHLTIPEIAEQLELNPRTVENYITQALKHLREVLHK